MHQEMPGAAGREEVIQPVAQSLLRTRAAQQDPKGLGKCRRQPHAQRALDSTFPWKADESDQYLKNND